MREHLNNLKYLLYCLVLLIIVGACSNNLYKTDLEKVSKEFPSEFLTHFPDDIHRSYQIKADFPAACLYEENKRCGVLLVASSEEIQINSLIEKSIQNVRINEKNNLVVNLSNEGNFTFTDKTSYPIPDFTTLLKDVKWEDDNSIEIINNELDIYIIESKKGKYLDEKYLINNTGMPTGWEHGFSRGIAINEEANLIVFWLEVW